MENIKCEYNLYLMEQIKKDYFLNELFLKDTVQLENTADAIQMIYFYNDLLNQNKFPKTIEAGLCRNIVILSYSVIESFVTCVGYHIQNNCYHCKHKCPECKLSILVGKEDQAFKIANDFLESKRIINMDQAQDDFYNQFRNNRNDVHLTKNTQKAITENRFYTRKYCISAMEFMQQFIIMLRANFHEYIRTHRCSNSR